MYIDKYYTYQQSANQFRVTKPSRLPTFYALSIVFFHKYPRHLNKDSQAHLFNSYIIINSISSATRVSRYVVPSISKSNHIFPRTRKSHLKIPSTPTCPSQPPRSDFPVYFRQRLKKSSTQQHIACARASSKSDRKNQGETANTGRALQERGGRRKVNLIECGRKERGKVVDKEGR